MVSTKYNTNVKHTTLEAFVTTVNDLGIELIINEALREVRKRQLIELIDDALVNKDEAAFNQYTAEYKNLEAFLGE
ncbi:IDEAL domain-containing protein [Staphylococcus aureus]|uniref:IDEAL domain-containing protein n=1 Tax=Staphylococcus aureus TaxID=1280 RepID=UPI0015E72461|nr:IDEAL domain-containing protein [Staphylococcus aureus]HDF1003717.1 IDEAL domain-containing protein [Staphylococcus aureus]HDF5741018.1 IDEAL domain-containing protein [Staphylococcus aureus]